MSNKNKTEGLSLEKLQALSFEEALAKLEENVTTMESGNLPLEKMMEAFEEGQTLAAICTDKLKAVEKKIEVLKKRASGETEWVDFNESPAQTRNAPPVQSPATPSSSSNIDDDDLFF